MRGVPVLIVKIVWGDKRPIGKQCLLLAFFDFNFLKFSKQIIISFVNN